MITEKLLFAVHRGTVAGKPAGVIMGDHCMPIACSHGYWERQCAPVAENGIYALWEATGDAEEFFQALGIESVQSNGLWVYYVEYDTDRISPDDEDVPWLNGGIIRRPSPFEIAPLAEGKAPWDGVVL